MKRWGKRKNPNFFKFNMAETLQIITDIANGIEKKPGVTTSIAISSADFTGLMNEAVGLAKELFPGLNIDSQLKVSIFRNKCVITGDVSVDHPLFGHSEVTAKNVQIGNSNTPGLVEVMKSDIDKSLSLRVKALAVARGIDVDEEIAKVIENPSQSLQELMEDELYKQGVKLDRLGLKFVGDKLHLDISGNKVGH